VEDDEPEILSGLVNGVTCGAPLAIAIRNTNARSSDYSETRYIPRPSHADYTAHVKYGGYHDAAGGGHFSGRLTAPLCAAGGICIQILRSVGVDAGPGAGIGSGIGSGIGASVGVDASSGIGPGAGVEVGAHILSIGGARDDAFDPVGVSAQDFISMRQNALPVLNREACELMLHEILDAREAGDSVGGVIECAIIGLPAGLGDPMFDGVENRIASIIFGIPGVKGIDFGSGFACAAGKGSQNNDSFYMDGDKVKTRTNNCGGILGGITNGMPVLFRAAFKPTPSIAMRQDSVNLLHAADAVLEVRGRHDPCIVARAAPCVEAAAAIAVYDAYLDR
jgi:chorismate synthase